MYTDEGVHIGLNDEEFSKLIASEKQRIVKRESALERFDYWEIPDRSLRGLGRLLLSRARSTEEKELVQNYIKGALR